jgi:hypothetical protein
MNIRLQSDTIVLVGRNSYANGVLMLMFFEMCYIIAVLTSSANIFLHEHMWLPMCYVVLTVVCPMYNSKSKKSMAQRQHTEKHVAIISKSGKQVNVYVVIINK